MLSSYFKITSFLDEILLRIWFRFGSPNPLKSYLGGVLGRLEGVWRGLEAFRGCLGASWKRVGARWSVLEPSCSVLEPSWKRLGTSCGGLSCSDAPTRIRPEPVGRG